MPMVKDGAHKGDFLMAITNPNRIATKESLSWLWTKVKSALSGKADKAPHPTEGNFASLDSNGNPVDSGHKHSDYLTSHQDISWKKDKQIAVADPEASGTSITFIDTISQDEQGVITPTKKTVNIANDLTTATEGSVLDARQGKTLADKLASEESTTYSSWVNIITGVTVDTFRISKITERLWHIHFQTHGASGYFAANSSTTIATWKTNLFGGKTVKRTFLPARLYTSASTPYSGVGDLDDSGNIIVRNTSSTATQYAQINGMFEVG